MSILSKYKAIVTRLLCRPQPKNVDPESKPLSESVHEPAQEAVPASVVLELEPKPLLESSPKPAPEPVAASAPDPAIEPAIEPVPEAPRTPARPIKSQAPTAYMIVQLNQVTSNGIRFSITDLDPKTARILPTVYQNRCGVSLYDAQYKDGKQVPIPDAVIEEVVGAFKGFKDICRSFGVTDDNVRVIATEATRKAMNSAEFRNRLEDATQWPVYMLKSQWEGRVGAMGVASSFSSVRGLVMDLGGGSTQITWLIMHNNKLTVSPKGAISLPYGAAALMERLHEHGLKKEVTERLKAAVKDLDIPEEILKDAEHNGGPGIKLYLSGGGFRGWGYRLMSNHSIKPYPIPVINGFDVSVKDFDPKDGISDGKKIFGVSKRRDAQAPAVKLLIDTFCDALPQISHVYFAQGGVREGVLFGGIPEDDHFTGLSADVQALHPINAATKPYAPKASSDFVALLRNSIPNKIFDEHAPNVPDFLSADDVLITSLVDLINYHGWLPKDSRALAGLRSSTAGVLAGVHGLAHKNRALLALALCKRWGGDVAPVDEPFHKGLVQLVGEYNAWWAEYAGTVAAAIGDTYPSGSLILDSLQFKSKWEIRDHGKHGKEKWELSLEIAWRDDIDPHPGWLEDLEKLGKKKHWPGDEGIRINIVQAKSLST